MLKISIFKLQVNCPGCNMYHTVTSLGSVQICQNCGKNINMEYFFRSSLFGAADIKNYLNAYLSGNIEQAGGTGGVENTGSYRLSYSSARVYCEECRETVSEGMITEAINLKKPVKCGKCGHAMPVKIADDFIRRFHPFAIAVINDSEGIDEAVKNTDKTTALVFKCMSCGAGLELTKDTGRTMKCSYCGNENYLPDSIWTKLHPHKEVSPLFVVLDLNRSHLQESLDYFINVTVMKIYNRHFENFIREYFENPFKSDALNAWFEILLSAENNKTASFNLDIEKIKKTFFSQMAAGYENHDLRLREITAQFGRNMPDELQSKLLKDTEENVRIKLAGNLTLNKNILEKLKSDSSPAVVSAASRQKRGFFNRLFG